ncbi:FAD-dependent oxidoreductase [Fibrella arboris]|uniref:FAD-dependent oxidoreductase n=1 Tax=Fibrella arboris TaxID=3242486 RepID=UPI00352199C7
MLVTNKQIAIVGGGPGGLTLARLLQQRGASVNVYERDAAKDARVQGATIDLHEESALEALRQAGLLDEFYKNYRPGAGKLRVVDKDTRVYLDDHDSGEYTEDRPEIDRGPLRDLLVASLRPDTVIWNSHFIGMTAVAGGWELQFKNGVTAQAAIVIAADGARSKIRPYLTPIQPIYSGITIIEGNVYQAEQRAPALYELVKGGKIFALSDEKTLILSAKGDGSLSFYTGCKVAEDWTRRSGINFDDRAQVQEWFQREFGAWNPVWQELVDSHDAWFIARPQYHFPPDQRWTTLTNLTMIGDAAHRMPPYAGEGVNMAMLDALDLAQCLTGDFPDVASAMATFETRMLTRAADVTNVTLRQTEALHAPDGLDRLLTLFDSFSTEQGLPV